MKHDYLNVMVKHERAKSVLNETIATALHYQFDKQIDHNLSDKVWSHIRSILFREIYREVWSTVTAHIGRDSYDE